MVQPALPAEAKRSGVKGPVVLEIKISEAGEVTDVRIVRGYPMLNKVAEETVRLWKYEPTILDGIPVAVWTTVVLNFLDR